MSLAGLGLQGITVSPRFIFGVNGELRNNLHLIEEHKLLYTAGHNVVVYSTDEKNQYFLPGQEGTEKITCIAVSASKKYLAVCERTTRALCTIYDINSQKKKKTLPDPDIDCKDYQSREFLSACFNPKDENRYIITLTGQPDWQLILWDWEKLKIITMINIGITGIPASINQKGSDLEPEFNFQISYNKYDSTSVVVTGMDTYKYYRIEDGEFQADHTQVNNKDKDIEISTKYSCHGWMQDGRLIVCTELGEIILCETDGSYMAYIPESPSEDEGAPFKIESVTPFSRGFIVSGENKIYAYEKTEDQRAPYRLITRPIENPNSHFISACLSQSEDYLYCITQENQLKKVDIPLYDGAESTPKFEDVHCAFHTQEITGLDVCIRKQLIVTCSKDRSVKIWNYVNKSLEISHAVQEDAISVAFHPSGFHVIVAIQDKIMILNVLSKQLQMSKSIQVKQCKEIQFSNGGHLFAAAYGTNATYVYNFYTGENPPNFQFRGHTQKVRSIDWFEDDMGFVSTSSGGDVYFWDLINVQEGGSYRIADKDFTQKHVQMTSVVNIPGRQHEVFCVGNDKKIWNSNQQKTPFDVTETISQVCTTHNGKALFAGVGESSKPGSVMIYKVSDDSKGQCKIDKINEVQAHSKPIERMRLSYDNHHLFTVGKDGCLIIHDVKDRDPKGKSREREGLPFSDEILTEKQEIETFIQDKEQLENDLNGQGSESFDKVMQLKRKDEQINKLQEELSSSQLQHRNRYDSLNENKRDLEQVFEERIKALVENQQIELEENRNTYSQKMLEDAAKFQELQAKKEEEARNFEETIADVIESHNQKVNAIMDKYHASMESQTAETEQMRKEIQNKRQDNDETIRQIQGDAKFEREDIMSKNTQNQKQVQEMSLRSKAELQLTITKLGDLSSDIDQLNRQLQDKKLQHKLQTEATDKLRLTIKTQGIQILEKDQTIGELEKKIYSLKKKTQELEKFKFVLDYKIKELKRDIAPRGLEITKLKKETNDMDRNLKHYNKINANLGYIVDDLRTRQEHMGELIKKNKSKIRSNDIFVKGFKNAIYWVVQYIDDFDQLKWAVNKNLYPYVKDQEMKNVEIDPDIKKEYENQRRYLENSQQSLKKRLEKEQQIHKEDNMNIMRENIKLIKMISDLRTEVKELVSKEKNTRTIAKMRANQSQMMQGSKVGEEGGSPQNSSRVQGGLNEEQAAQQNDLQMKRQFIEELRKRLINAQEENNYLQQEMNNMQQMQQEQMEQQQ